MSREEIISYEKSEVKTMYKKMCNYFAGVDPYCDTMPMVRLTGTAGQEAMMNYLRLTIDNYDLPPDERRKAVFDNMSATEYIDLSNYMTANGVCKKLNQKEVE